MHFSELGLLPQITQALFDKGYQEPTPIQAQAIPAILSGRDVMAAAQTGTGKTAGFTLPMLHLLSQSHRARPNQVRSLILTPTRELADQVWQSVRAYSQHLPLSSHVVYGGVKINPQMMKLRRGADVLVATPGRLIDLYQQNAIRFDHLEIFVLDEADRMLDMGFIHDIKRIIKLLPKQKQNLLFSATFSADIRELAKGLINDPIEVSVAPANSTAKSVDQCIYEVDKGKRSALLQHLIKHHQWQQVLVFTRTKHGANNLVKELEKAHITASAIHGNKSQNARMKALAGFKNQEVRVLVATDIVARGLDIQELPYVVNFDLPNIHEDYVHRIGRTGRAGASGEAISFVTAEDIDELFGIERLIQQVIARRVEPGFEPARPLRASVLDTRPIKAKKTKKQKQPKTDADILAELLTDDAQPSQREQKPHAERGQASRSPREQNARSARDPNGKRDAKPRANAPRSNPSVQRDAPRPSPAPWRSDDSAAEPHSARDPRPARDDAGRSRSQNSNDQRQNRGQSQNRGQHQGRSQNQDRSQRQARDESGRAPAHRSHEPRPARNDANRSRDQRPAHGDAHRARDQRPARDQSPARDDAGRAPEQRSREPRPAKRHPR